MTTTWIKADLASAIPLGKIKEYKINNIHIAIAHSQNQFFAFSALCTHAQCPLAAGQLDQDQITCPCHGSKFNLKTGEVLALPAVTSLKIYLLKVENNTIFVGL